MTPSSRRGFLRRTALVALAVSPSVTAAQPVELPEVNHPSLSAQADSVQEFVPPGWRLELEEGGDLNGDSLVDRVLVLRAEDSLNVVTHGGLGADPLDTNPRILAVVFGRSDGSYSLALENHTLIPRNDQPTADDPIDGVAGGGVDVVRGTMRVTLGYWMSAGGWDMGHITYTFRWQDDQFALIGYDKDNIHRGSGAETGVSINYLTRRVEHTRGSIDSDKVTVERSDLPSWPLLSIEEVGDGYAFRWEVQHTFKDTTRE